MKNNSGFSLIEALIIFVIVLGLITAGIIVDKNTINKKGPINIPTKWLTFTNKFVSFKYPSNWTAFDSGGSSPKRDTPVLDVEITSPYQRSTIKFPEVKDANYTSLTFTLSNTNPFTLTGPLDLNESECPQLGNCNISQIIPITIDGNNLKLLVTPLGATTLAITDDPSVNLSSNYFYESFHVANSLVMLLGGVDYENINPDNDYSCTLGCELPTTLSDYNDMKVYESSTAFKNMLTTLQSMTFH